MARRKAISYVISVSLGTGCYRHLRVSGRETLHDFADDILWAFGFDHDHLYSFFMDNQWWSMDHAYHSPYAEESPYADEVRLIALKLEKGQKFKFLFDYGDEWRFQCKVLNVLNEQTEETEIVRIKGKAPEQYPEYPDDDEDEDIFDDVEEAAPPSSPFSFFEVLEKEKNVLPIIEQAVSTAADELPAETLEIPEILLQAGFRFRSEKLWKKLFSDEFFAFRLSSGEISYCCIMGYGGETTALTLFVGEEGYQSLYSVLEKEGHPDDIFRMFLQQNCWQIGLDNKSDLPGEIIELVQTYAKAHQINMRGKKSYPNFVRYQSYYAPVMQLQQTDIQYLLEAERAAHAVAEALQKTSKEELGFYAASDTLPMLIPDGDGFRWETVQKPEKHPQQFPSPVLQDAALTEQISGLEAKGCWECAHYIQMHPVVSPGQKRWVFPSLLLMAAPGIEQFWVINGAEYYPDEAEALLRQMAEDILQTGYRPEKILTEGERSAAFLQHFCKQCNISLEMKETLPTVSIMKEQVQFNIFNRSVKQVVEQIEDSDDVELLNISPEMKEILTMMLYTGLLPESVAEKLEKIL